MDQGIRRDFFTVAIWSALSAIASGCGGNGGPESCPAPFSQSLTGTWELVQTYDSSFPECSGADTYELTLAQEGSQVIWQKSERAPQTLTLCGNVLQVPGEQWEPTPGLRFQIDAYAAEFDSEVHFHATSRFRVSQGDGGSTACEGTVSIVGMRL